MTLLTAGYWPSTYWAESYWPEDYWQDYGYVEPSVFSWRYNPFTGNLDCYLGDLTGAEVVALLEALGEGSRLSHTKLDDVGASDHHARYADAEADARIALHAAVADAHHVAFVKADADALYGAIAAVAANTAKLTCDFTNVQAALAEASEAVDLNAQALTGVGAITSTGVVQATGAYHIFGAGGSGAATQELRILAQDASIGRLSWYGAATPRAGIDLVTSQDALKFWFTGSVTERLNLDSSGNLNVVSHNGSTAGLKLGGTLVTKTAAQLNAMLKCKVVDIGNWDMHETAPGNGSNHKTVAHGLTFADIRSVSVMIRNDDDDDLSDITYEEAGPPWGNFFVTPTNIVMEVTTNEGFDSTSYDTESGFNRGYIVIWYV